ncbi:MAG: Tricarboxylate transporter family protein [Alphaproteobacteria bacterium]|jgi:putative tricarboxylic transport membrane protein|nr:Tricarboxylate transporter family protein [Alphaproteobacteria bacterium]MBT7755636.1 Tricarboxylate transporter family protein [Candidatus Magasanikbacteria bacterium]
MEMIIAGLLDSLAPTSLMYVFLGVAIGVLIGAIPGINGPMAIALFIPVTYYMSALTAIGFLIGLNKGAFFGGAISAVLLRTPGTPEAAATAWDGYPLTQQGKGEKALRMALYSSVAGDFISTGVLIVIAAPLAAVALFMGPAEIFALISLALTVIAGIGTSSICRGLIAASLGLAVGLIGTEPVTALPRLTFDIYQLGAGVKLIPVAIGLLAFSEILIQLERIIIKDGGEHAPNVFSSKKEDRLLSWKEFIGSARTLLRGSAIGIGVGAMPGLGAPVASFMSYDQAMKRSKSPEEFGKGRLEGIGASESANSAVVGASLIPLFVLGIPGNLAVAMLMGAFMIHGMQPGPLMFEENAQLMYGVYGSLIIASFFLLIIGRFGLKLFCKAVEIPSSILYPIIIFTCIMGSYLGQSSMFDVIVMLIFGVVGYFMRKFDFTYVAFLIGFILAPEWERALQQVVILSQFDTSMFFRRPVAMGLMALTFFVIGKTFWTGLKPKK